MQFIQKLHLHVQGICIQYTGISFKSVQSNDDDDVDDDCGGDDNDDDDAAVEMVG